MRSGGPLISLLLAGTVAGSACRSRAGAPPPAAPAPSPAAVVERYADIALGAYEEALAGARSLRVEVERFLTAPTTDGLARARASWIQARAPYTRTEVFRFYGGPIDAVETLVNAWPVDESYIDDLVGEVEGGPITAERIAALNERGGETNISAGYHALEFLLWGADRSEDGPGDRPHTDFLPTAPHGRRRADYLREAAALLVRHLEEVVAAWTPDRPGSYRSRLLALPSREALGLVLKGMGSLSGPELAGERLTVAYQTKDQEDEHSCFSDNTHADLENNALGIQDVYLGRLRGAPDAAANEPASLRALLAQADPALADRIARQLDACVAAVRAIPPPFDRAILGEDDAPGRVAVGRAIAAFQALTASLAEAATALGIRLNL